MNLFSAALLTAALAASPDVTPSSACWLSVTAPPLGYGFPEGARTVGASAYPDVRVASPVFHDVQSGLWLGDIDRLLRYDTAQEGFVTEWESRGEIGTQTFVEEAFVFLPYPEDARSSQVAIDVVPLRPGAAEPRRLTVDVGTILEAEWGDRVRTSGRGWFTPVGIEASSRLSDGHQVVYLVIEFARSRDVRAAVVELALGASAIEVLRSWPLTQLVDRFHVHPGDAGRPDLALLIDNGLYAYALPLDDSGAEADAIGLSDITAIAPSHATGSLWVGRADGCVARLTRDGDELSAGEQWCPRELAPDLGIDHGYVEVLAEMDGGRVFVSLGPSVPDGSSARPLSAVTLQPVAGRFEPRAVPVDEALRPPPGESGELTLASIGAWFQDRSGRVWGAVRGAEGELAEIQRFDRALEHTRAVVGHPVVTQVPFAGGAAVLAEDGDGSHTLWWSVAAPRAVVPLPGEHDDVVAIASSGERLFALARFGPRAALLRWDAPGTPPTTIRQLDAVPADVTGFWWDGRELELATPAGIVPITEDGRAHRPETIVCSPPRTVPGRLDGKRICAVGGGGWATEGTRTANLLATSDGWWTWERRGERLVAAEVNGVGRLDVLAGRIDLALALHDDRILGRSPDGLHVAAAGQPPSVLLTRGQRLRRRDLDRACQDPRVEDARETDATDAFVDPGGSVWLTLGDNHAIGPVMPAVPRLDQTWAPWADWRIRLEDPNDADPRVMLSSSCAPDAPTPSVAEPALILTQTLMPLRRCTVTATNVYGTGQTARTAWLAPPRAVAMWGLLAAIAPLIGVRVLRRRREAYGQVEEFAEKANIPYVVGPPATGNMFFGRKRLLQEFMNTLRSGEAYILIADEKRIGKTSVLLRLKQLLEEHADTFTHQPIPVYFSMERSQQGKAFFRELWRAVRSTLAERELEDAILYEDPQDEGEAFSNVVELLHLLHDDDLPYRVVFLFDEFQILAGDNASAAARDAAQRLRSLTAEQCRDRLSWVGAGVASQLNPKPRDEDSDLLLIGPRFTLGHLDQDAARELIRAPIADLPIRFTSLAEEAILHHSEGHPFIIQHICRLAVNEVALQMTTSRRLRRRFISEADVGRHLSQHALHHLLGSA